MRTRRRYAAQPAAGLRCGRAPSGQMGFLEERQGLAGTHRASGDSKGTVISPRIKYANESPDLHVIHKAFS